MEPAITEQRPLRVVLVDFDWGDADLLPELLNHSEINVRLVAGEKAQEAGVRVAELCGVPRSVDLADLTREIFDLALVSEQSPRRAQIERLLSALGTPVETPQHFLGNGSAAATNGVHAEPGTNGHSLDDALAQAIPDSNGDLHVDRATSPAGQEPDSAAATAAEQGPIARPTDPPGIRAMLDGWLIASSGRSAELHPPIGPHPTPIVTGPTDALLTALVEQVCHTQSPQIMVMASGPERGRLWGAWPIHVGHRCGAVAAAAIDPDQGKALWEASARTLSEQWSDAVSAAPPTDHEHGWLSAEAYAAHLESIVEINRREGERFDLHRLRMNGPLACIDRFCASLPEQLRANDVLCRPTPDQVVLLCHGPVGSFAFVRRRLMKSWEQAWREAGPPSPPPPIIDDHVEIIDPQDAEGFLTIGRDWLGIR